MTMGIGALCQLGAQSFQLIPSYTTREDPVPELRAYLSPGEEHRRSDLT